MPEQQLFFSLEDVAKSSVWRPGALGGFRLRSSSSVL
jgi:hypothetical protein